MTTERRGLKAAAMVALCFVAMFVVLSLWPGFTPLYDEGAAPSQRLTPLFPQSAGSVCAAIRGERLDLWRARGHVHSHRDDAMMMAKGLEGVLPFWCWSFLPRSSSPCSGGRISDPSPDRRR